MQKFTHKWYALYLTITLFTFTSSSTAQTAAISADDGNGIIGYFSNFTVTTRDFGSNDNNRRFDYTITGPVNSTATFTCTDACNTQTHSLRFTAPGTYTVSVTVTRTQGGGSAVATASTDFTVFVPNMYATSGTGDITTYNVNIITGAINAGPVTVGSPGVSTAALGINALIPTFDPEGCIYFAENTSTASNNGVVRIFAMRRDGTGRILVGTIDMNGTSDSGLGFVRLGFDPAGYGWIIAGNGSSQLRIAKFRGRGLNPIDNINTFGLVNLTVDGGTIADFQNGDLAFDGQGTLFALANVTGGTATIYNLNSTSNPSTLIRRWTVLNGTTGTGFTGSVNGVATSGNSIHISTSNGIFFVNAATTNSTTGTISAFPVSDLTGITDLASPSSIASGPLLPVRLLEFSGLLRNNIATLRWQSEAETNFDRFEVERSTNNGRFDRVATLAARGNGSSQPVSYETADDLSGQTAQAFFYRLKMIDTDGSFTYSRTVMIRKDRQGLKGFSLAPNPVVNHNTVLRFEAIASTQIDIRIVDMNGRLMLQQRNNVVPGINSILINNLQQLQPGAYVVQTMYEGELQSIRFTVNR